MKKCLPIIIISACFFLVGCDTRNTNEKLSSPTPDFTTRQMMACPTCGAPQKPYRLTEITSYYRCSGLPPKFAYHAERLWEHDLDK